VSEAPPLLVIAGATATGKTGLSIRLAEALRADGIPAEIVSADSRQVYRGLDIGTAKVTPAERGRVPHHGLDLVEPDAPFSVADYATHARTALAGIAERGGLAILVGGTGLYLRAVADGLPTDALPNDPATRARLEADLARDGLPALAARLTAVAPTRAAAIDLRNPRRVVRALEIAELQGDAPLPEPRGYPGLSAWLGLMIEPETHREWIANRARGQFAGGLVEEARELRRRFDPRLPAFSAIGYREAWSVVDGGLTLDDAIDLDIRRNLAFARRQRTWFRSEPSIDWLNGSEDVLGQARAAADRLLEGH
jgi:tRNA dimethylallyltransferase